MNPNHPAEPSDADLRIAAASFARPRRWRSAVQLMTSFGLFLAGCASMYLTAPISAWLTLILAIPTGALMIRVFIVQHDCGHGSFFASRRANTLVGWLCSLCTLTPYGNWSRHHRLHHANWNNLDRTDGGSDIYSTCLTVKSYLEKTGRQRFIYRLVRHPLIANVVLPPFVFLLLYRVPFDTPRGWTRERRSVYFTDAVLFAVFASLSVLFGWREVLLVHVPVVAVASIVGVWLFTLQHRFAGARWAGADRWRFVDAALDGSSWFDLPPVLHWLTGNIGFHHVHHLDQRVPNYQLSAAHAAIQALHPVPRLGLFAGLRATRFTLWDEANGRLVCFKEAHRFSRSGKSRGARAEIG